MSINDDEVKKLLKLLVQGNIERTGEEILKELNQNGLVVCKAIYDPMSDTVKYELIKTELYLCQ